jgi:hypothetical protein
MTNPATPEGAIPAKVSDSERATLLSYMKYYNRAS